jgi:hypothetical protein
MDDANDRIALDGVGSRYLAHDSKTPHDTCAIGVFGIVDYD